MATKQKTKFGAAMFDSIKAALNKSSDSSGGQFANIMSFPAGHTYTLRLVPNIEDPEKTFFHHWVNGWNSRATGKYMSFLGLQTMGERDPISELRWKLWKSWKEENPKAENKEYKAEIMQKEQWLVNVYVINDPHKPENNGTVKILRMGPQLKKIIDDATEGERADELGWDIFDLTKGHDFKIVAEKKGEYTTFESSFITTKSKVSLDEDEIDKICSEIHDLEAVYPVKTYDELQDALNEHFFIGAEKEERKPLAKAKQEAVADDSDDDDDDDIPMFHEEKKAASKSPPKPANKEPKKDKKDKKEDNDDEIDDLLAGLDD
jgi:hypothetical protein